MHGLCASLHFLDQVSVCDDPQLVKNQVNATFDEKCFVDFECLV